MITLSRFLFTFSLSLFLLFLSVESQAATKSCSLLNLVGADYVVTVGCGFDDPIRPDGDIYDSRCSGGKLSNGASCQPGWRCYESWGVDVCKKFRECATGENWRNCINDFLPEEKETTPPVSPTQCTDNTPIWRYYTSSEHKAWGRWALTIVAACQAAGNTWYPNSEGFDRCRDGKNKSVYGEVKTIGGLATQAEKDVACTAYVPPKPTEPEPENPTASEPKPSASEPVKSDSEFLKKISETMDKVLRALTGENPSDTTTGTGGSGSGTGGSGSGTGGSSGGGGSGGILGEISKLTGEGEYDDGSGSGGEGDFGVGDGGSVVLGGPFSVNSYFATSSSCPAPVSIYGNDFTFTWLCEVLLIISRILIAVAYLWSAFIFYGALVGTTKDD